MSEMFRNVSNVNKLDCGNFDMSQVDIINSMFKAMARLKVLDLTHVEFTADDYQEILLGTNNLEVLKCDKPSTIHKLVELLPDRNGQENPGKLITTVQDRLNPYCFEVLLEKNWEITSEVGLLVADYIFDPAIHNSMIPVMNDGYLDDCVIEDEVILNYVEPTDEVEVVNENEGIMTLEETEGRMVIRRKIYNLKGESPSSIRFGAAYMEQNLYTDEVYHYRLSLIEVLYIDISNCTDITRLFNVCKNLRKVEGMLVTNKITAMSSVFFACKKLTSIDLSNWDTRNVTTIQAMFYHCDSLTSLDLSNWDVSNVSGMTCVFTWCSGLQSLNLNNWNTSNVIHMNGFLQGCALLSKLDLSGFDTSKVTTMNNMLNGCKSTYMDLSNFIINDDCDITYMIDFQKSIKYLKLDDAASLEKLLPQLPTRDVNDKGHIVTYNPDALSSTAKTTLTNKNWVVHSVDECTIAAYGFDNTVCEDVMPIFNEDYDASALSISDHVHGGYFVHRDIMNFEGKLPSTIKFGGDEPDARTNALMQIGDINLTGITDYSEMFKNCTNLNYLNICVGEKTPTNVSHMFEGCSNLELFDIYRMEFDEITSYEGMFAGCNKLCKIRVRDIQNEVFMNILRDENNNFAEVKEIVSSRVHDLTEEERGVIEGLGWGLKGMIAHYAYDAMIANDYIPVFNDEFTDFEVFDYLNERQGIMHRTIESNQLPTLMRFGQSAAGNDGVENIPKNLLSLLEVYDCDTNNLNTMENMFDWCINVIKINANWVTSKVTNMRAMFNNCQKLTSLDVSGFDTSNVTDMRYMFSYCNKLTSLDVSNFNTGNVTTMRSMFANCYNLTSLDVSNFNTSKVNNISNMFSYCNKLTSLDVNNWDTSNVVAAHYMFDACSSLKVLHLSNWDTTKISLMQFMFASCHTLSVLDLCNFTINENTNIEVLFSSALRVIRCNNAESVRMIVPKLITKEQELEPGIIISDAEISEETLAALAAKNWTVVTSDSFIKVAEYVYDPDVWASLIPEFNAEFVRYFINDEEIEGEGVDGTVKTLVKRTIWSLGDLPIMMKFGYPYGDNLIGNKHKSLLEVNYIDMNAINTMRHMFRLCTNIRKIELNTIGDNVTDMYTAFANCYKLTSLDVSNFNTSNVTNMDYMFYRCESLTLLDVSNFDTGKVTTMEYMFGLCKSLTSLDVSNFDTSKVTIMRRMFAYCESLTSLDVSNWDTSNVTDMYEMFVNCKSLTTLDVSNWNTGKVYRIHSMFYGCGLLESIDLSNFELDKMTNANGFGWMFSFCSNLKEVKLPKFNMSTSYACMFRYATSIKFIDLSNTITITENISELFEECHNLETIDISNIKLNVSSNVNELFYNVGNTLTDIGMVHCDVETINIVAAQTPVQPITIWIGTHLTAEEIASLDQYDHITYSIQLENAERLLLSSPLLEGDEIKVVDGQLCHVHNTGMDVFDGSTDEGWVLGSVGTSNYRIELYSQEVLTYGHSYSNYLSRGFAICDRIPRLYTDTTADATIYPLDKSFISLLDSGTSIYNRAASIKLSREIANTVAEGKAWLAKNPLTLIYSLAEPWTEVIDLPRANIDVELYENGVLYMSDPTASINRVDSDGNMIIDTIQGDSVMNVSNQQFSVELSEESDAPIQTGEILEDNSIRPKFYGRTMVNLMDIIGWGKFIHPTDNYGAYIYNSHDITNKSITITNFNDKPIKIGIYNSEVQNADGRGVDIAANSSVIINLSEVESLFSVLGRFTEGWSEENMHELKNINIFEGELSEDELPENRMNGMRNAFDKYQTTEGKYRVEMVVSNSPIQFGKAGRK